MGKIEERFTRKRLNSARITTILSITLVLFAIGLVGLLLLHAGKLSDYVKENIIFEVYLNKNSKEAEIIRLQKKLDAMPEVKSTAYITEEKAAENFTSELGEDFVGFIGQNPLYASIEVRLRAEYADAVYFEKIENEIRQDPVIKEVFYQKSLVHEVNENVRKISLVISVFCLLLLLIAVTLINNTIRLSVYSKRLLIRSMQLVGATESFIRKPFLNAGILQGFVSSLIAIGLLSVVIFISRREIPDIVSIQDIDLFLILFAGVIITGFVISWLSTFFAVRKFLRIRFDHLYY